MYQPVRDKSELMNPLYKPSYIYFYYIRKCKQPRKEIREMGLGVFPELLGAKKVNTKHL